MIKKRKLHFINRRIHLYTGLFMIPFIFIFGLSGISFNHSTFLSSERSVDYFTLNEKESLNKHFPKLDELAIELIDSLVSNDIIDNAQIKNIRYNNTVILRSLNDEADYRIQVDIPTNHVQIITLPDFAINPAIVKRGQLESSFNFNSSELLADMDKILQSKGFNQGKSRVQRIPYVFIDVESENKNFRVIYDLNNGNYRIDDLNKRKFKLNYLVGNLHELHGYPLSGFSLKWMWVFFADVLGFLMMIWAITGLIMWFKMKRQFVIGLIILSISFILFTAIIINQYELAY